jgi:phage recombination protein Bet
LARIAERYYVDPDKMLSTLKATAFKTDGRDGVTNEQMMSLLVVADQYKLNPFTRELFAFPDKVGGIVPVVSVDGWSRIINAHPAFDGIDFEFDDSGVRCTCTIYRKDRGHPTRVTESLAECKRNTPPWNSHPRRMLRHKAMIQCARLAFGFVGVFDDDEAQRIVEVQATTVDEPARPAIEAAAVKTGGTSAKSLGKLRAAIAKPTPAPAPAEPPVELDEPAHSPAPIEVQQLEDEHPRLIDPETGEILPPETRESK